MSKEPIDGLTADERLTQLSEEFIDELRRGATPDPESYCHREPDLAHMIRETFPALMLLEHVGPHEELTEVDDAPTNAVKPEVRERIGEYRLIREIGRGGVGVVYEAMQESVDRRVALKLLNGNRSASVAQRFQAEARAAARLRHDHIVAVFDAGEADGCLFLAMQLINGRSLDQFRSAPREPASTEPLPRQGTRIHDNEVDGEANPVQLLLPMDVARVGVQAADALEFAHQSRIIHRDIKPSNLIMDPAGRVWVADFGLARLDDQSLTRTGEVMGTLAYMPPERFQGIADERGDVYSLGLTLFELIAGRRAFSGVDQIHLIRQISKTRPPSLTTIAPATPPDLAAVIEKACAHDREQRYLSAATMRDDLQRVLDGHPVLARSPSVIRRAIAWTKREPLPAALLGGLAIITLAALILTGVLTGKINELDRANTELGQRRTAAVLATENISHQARQLEASNQELAGTNAALEATNKELTTTRRQRSLQLLDLQIERARNLIARRGNGQRLEALATLRDASELSGKLGVEEKFAYAIEKEAVTALSRPDVIGTDEGRLRFFVRQDELIVSKPDGERRTLRRPDPQRYQWIVASPCGGYALLVELGGRYFIWEIESRQLCLTGEIPNPGSLRAICFLRDGESVAVAQKNKAINLYSLPSGTLERTIEVSERPGSVAMSPNRRWIAYHPSRTVNQIRRNEFSFVDTESRTETPLKTSHERIWVHSVSDFGHVATCFVDQQLIQVRHHANLSEVNTLRTSGHVKAIGFLSHQTRLLAWLSDGRSELWDVVSGQRLMRLTQDTSEELFCDQVTYQFLPHVADKAIIDDRVAATLPASRTAAFVDSSIVAISRPLAMEFHHLETNVVIRVPFPESEILDAGRDYMVTQSHGLVMLWKKTFADGKVVVVPERIVHSRCPIDQSRWAIVQGRYFATFDGQTDHVLRIRDLDSGSWQHCDIGEEIYGITHGPGSNVLVRTRRFSKLIDLSQTPPDIRKMDRAIAVFPLCNTTAAIVSQTAVATSPLPSLEIARRKLELSPGLTTVTRDGRMLAHLDLQGTTIDFFDTNSWQPVGSVPRSSGSVQAIHFSPDSRRMMVVGEQSVVVWNLSRVTELLAEYGLNRQFVDGLFNHADSPAAPRQLVVQPGLRDNLLHTFEVMGKRASRLPQLREALERVPENIGGWVKLATLASRIDNQAHQAEPAIQRALELAPWSEGARRAAVAVHQRRRAWDMADAAIADAKQHLVAPSKLESLVHYHRGRFEQALAGARQLAKVEAPVFAMRYGADEILLGLGHIDEAIALYKRAGEGSATAVAVLTLLEQHTGKTYLRTSAHPSSDLRQARLRNTAYALAVLLCEPNAVHSRQQVTALRRGTATVPRADPLRIAACVLSGTLTVPEQLPTDRRLASVRRLVDEAIERANEQDVASLPSEIDRYHAIVDQAILLAVKARVCNASGDVEAGSRFLEEARQLGSQEKPTSQFVSIRVLVLQRLLATTAKDEMANTAK